MKKISLLLLSGIVMIACGKKGVTDEVLKSELSKLVGEKGWKAAVFDNLSKDMSCEDVAKSHSGLKCESGKDYSFPEVKVSGNPIVSGYKFTFKDNKLSSATIEFNKAISRAQFQKVTLPVLEAKWGKSKDGWGDKGIITWIADDFSSTQVAPMGENYQLENAMPKK